MSEERYANLNHPAGADLFRVLAVGTVGWFHIWQQSWVSAGPLDFWVRTGYLWVDGMILLSAFCLFLPYANAMAEGKSFPGCDALPFYQKRAVRILPSYYVNLLFAFLISLAANGPQKEMPLELLDHLLLTQNFFGGCYTHSMTNGVTWTLTVLAVFYLAFPFLAHAVYRRPIASVAGLFLIQLCWRLFALSQAGTELYGSLFNQAPAFASTAAVGMAAAILFAFAGRSGFAQRLWGQAAFSAVSLVLLFAVTVLIRMHLQAENIKYWQLRYRTPLVAAMAAFLVFLCLGLPISFGRVWRFLSGISYNFYLWHQMLALWIKYTLRVPAWAGDVPPNQTGDAMWSMRFNLLAWAAAFAAALLFTYAVEKPAARWFTKQIVKHKCGRSNI